MSAFQPFAPGTDPATEEWDKAGLTLFFGGLSSAAWSAYAFETAICYTSEFRNSATDPYKAIIHSGLLCIAVYVLVPLSFQGALGLACVMAPGIVDGSGVAKPWRRWWGEVPLSPVKQQINSVPHPPASIGFLCRSPWLMTAWQSGPVAAACR